MSKEALDALEVFINDVRGLDAMSSEPRQRYANQALGKLNIIHYKFKQAEKLAEVLKACKQFGVVDATGSFSFEKMIDKALAEWEGVK